MRPTILLLVVPLIEVNRASCQTTQDVASKRLRMKKRGCGDEQLPLLHPPHLHMVPYIPGASSTVGTSIMTSASNIVGVSNTIGTSNSDVAGTSGMLLALALQGTRNITGARISTTADNNPSANRLVGANQPFLIAYPRNPRDNLKMLEIRAYMDAFATPLVLETELYASNTVAMWKRRYKKRSIKFKPLYWKWTLY